VKGRSISLFAVAQQVSASPVIRGISMIGSFGLPVCRRGARPQQAESAANSMGGHCDYAASHVWAIGSGAFLRQSSASRGTAQEATHLAHPPGEHLGAHAKRHSRLGGLHWHRWQGYERQHY
jgi:hypothetical protein